MDFHPPMANLSHIFPGGFNAAKEDALQSAMEQWLRKIEKPFLAQQEVGGGSRVDLMLCLSRGRPEPWCIVEVKTKLALQGSTVRDLANHLEQCVKYHFYTGLPVFLGPFFIPSMNVAEYFGGGSEPKYASAAFSAYAGRMNVGMLFIHADPGHEHDPEHWYGLRLTMRQQIVGEWSSLTPNFHDKWPTDQIGLVRFCGAASQTVRS